MIRHTLKVIQQIRGGSSSAAASSFQPSTVITKRSILDVAAALDPPLIFTIRTWDIVHSLYVTMLRLVKNHFVSLT